MVGLLAFVSTPDRHPGGSVCLKCFAGMKKRSHEFKTKRISIKIVNIVETREGRSCFHQLENMFRAVQEAKKLIFRSSIKFPFQRIQDQ